MIYAWAAAAAAASYEVLSIFLSREAAVCSVHRILLRTCCGRSLGLSIFLGHNSYVPPAAGT